MSAISINSNSGSAGNVSDSKIMRETIKGGMQFTQEFADLFAGYEVITGGSEGLKRSINALISKEIAFACIIFSEKPKALLMLGLSKKMAREGKAAKANRVSVKLAGYLPKLTDEQIASMDGVKRAQMVQARSGWPAEFRKISVSSIMRIALLAQDYSPQCEKGLFCDYRKLYGARVSQRLPGKLSGMSLKIREEAVGNYLRAQAMIGVTEIEKALKGRW